MGKAALRSELLVKLSLLSNDEIQALSFSLTNQIIKFFHSAPELVRQIGAAYLPLKTELAPVYQELYREVPLSLAFPVLRDHEMDFAIPPGIPKGGIWLDPPYSIVEPSWLLIPGVGFDLDGRRLGRGKGFYDRYLEGKRVLKIGLAWTEQIKDRVPVEGHDSHMDFLITENYCWNVNQQERF